MLIRNFAFVSFSSCSRSGSSNVASRCSGSGNLQQHAAAVAAAVAAEAAPMAMVIVVGVVVMMLIIITVISLMNHGSSLTHHAS